MNAQANTDFSRTTVIRSTKSSARREDIARPIARIQKEAVSVNGSVDKPYNLFQRLFLRVWGALTARHLI